MQVQGNLNGTANVTVNGNAATVSTNLTFTGYASNIVASVAGTSNSISVLATYSSGMATNQYGVMVTGTTNQVLAYDADGELTNDGAGRTFQWENGELTAVIQGAEETEYYYDGLGHRICLANLDSGTYNYVNYYLWSGSQLCEEYTGEFGVLDRTKRFFPQGETISVDEELYEATPYYFTRDHLGSVREVTDSTGTIQARYDYDPYGRKTLVQGTDFSDFGYAGMFFEPTSGLNLTLFRAYDPNAGRWLNQDPLASQPLSMMFPGKDGTLMARPIPAELLVSPNLYEYVGNNPINKVDPYGLWQITIGGGFGIGAMITFGNNGGSSWYNGQWNGGAWVGEGDGLFGDFNGDKGEEKCTSFSIGVRAHAEAGIEGATGVSVDGEASYDMWNNQFNASITGSVESPESVGVNGSATLDPNADQPFSTSVESNTGTGAGQFAGLGGQFYW